MVRSVSKRFAAVVVAATSVSLLSACEIAPSGGAAGGTATNPKNTAILARGWELPKETGVSAGARSVRGAHALVAIAAPDGGEIETADIAAPGQGSRLSGNPAGASARDPAEVAGVIVRSKRK